MSRRPSWRELALPKAAGSPCRSAMTGSLGEPPPKWPQAPEGLKRPVGIWRWRAPGPQRTVRQRRVDPVSQTGRQRTLGTPSLPPDPQTGTLHDTPGPPDRTTATCISPAIPHRVLNTTLRVAQCSNGHQPAQPSAKGYGIPTGWADRLLKRARPTLNSGIAS